jgi:hypothetical protein
VRGRPHDISSGTVGAREADIARAAGLGGARSAEPRHGLATRVRSERSPAKLVVAFTAANRLAQGHKLVAVELRRPSVDAGGTIERGPGRTTYSRARWERKRREKRRHT